MDNLALACVSCLLRKGDRFHATDPGTGETVPLFSPRQDQWETHFKWRGTEIIALTAVGRATIAALDLNRPLIRAIRSEEVLTSAASARMNGS